MKALDVFAGAGGLSQGARLAGFELVWAGEKDAEAVATYQAAFPDTAVVCRELTGDEVVPEGMDLMVGGPPCQPFSSSGKRHGQWDPRDGFPVFLKLLDRARPRAFLIEEVPTLQGRRHRDYFKQVVRSFDGYTARWIVLDAAEHGVPQRRRRLFIVGFRDPIDAGRFTWPGAVPRHVGLEQAIGDIVPRFGAGPTRHSRPVELGTPLEGARIVDQGRGGTAGAAGTGRAKSLLYKLQQPYWPSDTVTVSAETKGSEHALRIMVGLADGSRFERRLHWREVARLQTFPDDWPWAGGERAILRQLGNAVPCQLARRLAVRIADALGLDPVMEGFA